MELIVDRNRPFCVATNTNMLQALRCGSRLRFDARAARFDGA
jgi:hypothetical protein